MSANLSRIDDLFDPPARGGTIAQRNNNPGNLRPVGGTGFRSFSTPEEGHAALVGDLKAKMTGRTRTGLSGNSTLYDLFGVYAPTGDKTNDPRAYAENVAGRLGVHPATRIGGLLPRVNDLAEAIATQEGYYGASKAGRGSGAVQSDPLSDLFDESKPVPSVSQIAATPSPLPSASAIAARPAISQISSRRPTTQARRLVPRQPEQPETFGVPFLGTVEVGKHTINRRGQTQAPPLSATATGTAQTPEQAAVEQGIGLGQRTDPRMWQQRRPQIKQDIIAEHREINNRAEWGVPTEMPSDAQIEAETNQRLREEQEAYAKRQKWLDARTEEQRRVLETAPERFATLSPEEKDKSIRGQVNRALNPLTTGGGRRFTEGASSASGGAMKKMANALEIATAPVDELTGARNEMAVNLRDEGQMAQEAAARSMQVNDPEGVGLIGGLQRGLGGASVELPQLIFTGPILKGATLAVHGALGAEDQSTVGRLKGAAEGEIFRRGMGVTANIGRVGNALVWTGIPAAQGILEGKNPGEAIGSAVPFGVMAASEGKPVKVMDARGAMREAVDADQAAIKAGELKIVNPLTDTLTPTPVEYDAPAANAQMRARFERERGLATIGEQLAAKRGENQSVQPSQPNVVDAAGVADAARRVPVVDQPKAGRAVEAQDVAQRGVTAEEQPQDIVDQQTTPGAPVDQPRHVDLQQRHESGTEEGGQFKKETAAQREERLSQVGGQNENKPQTENVARISGRTAPGLSDVQPTSAAREPRPFEQTVYTGKQGGTDFKPGQQRASALMGSGFYFTNDADFTKNFGETVQARVSLKNPLYVDDMKPVDIDRLAGATNDVLREFSGKAIPTEGYQALGDLRTALNKQEQGLAGELMRNGAERLGHDGFVLENSPVAFYPEQIQPVVSPAPVEQGETSGRPTVTQHPSEIALADFRPTKARVIPNPKRGFGEPAHIIENQDPRETNWKIGDEGYFYRAGGLPESGRSRDYRDNKELKGVSVYPLPLANSFAGLKDADWYTGRGRIVGMGSDDEPLIAPIGEWKKFHNAGGNDLAGDAHRFYVEKALKSGQSVSPDVLVDYPDLQSVAPTQRKESPDEQIKTLGKRGFIPPEAAGTQKPAASEIQDLTARTRQEIERRVRAAKPQRESQPAPVSEPVERAETIAKRQGRAKAEQSLANRIAEAPSAREAKQSVKAENVSKRTGLTPTQSNYLAGRLREMRPELLPKSAVRAESAEAAEVISVPGDGEFKVYSREGADNLHRKLTGKEIPAYEEARQNPPAKVEKYKPAVGDEVFINTGKYSSSKRGEVVAARGDKALVKVDGEDETYPTAKLSSVQALRARYEQQVSAATSEQLTKAQETLKAQKRQSPEDVLSAEVVSAELERRSQGSNLPRLTPEERTGYEQSKRNVKEKLSGNRLTASDPYGLGLFADLAPDLIKIGKYHVQNGYREFKAWSEKMIQELGEGVRPHLEKLYGLATRGEVTSPKVEATRAEREARGLNPVEKQAYQTMGESYEKGKAETERGVIDPRRLAEEVAKTPRPLTATETGALGYDRARLLNAHDAVMAETEKAMEAKDTEKAAEGRVRLEQIERELDNNDKALELAGREWSMAGQARKSMIRRDYSLTEMVRRYKAETGKEPTPEVRAQIEGQARRIKDLEAQLSELEERRSKEAAKKTIDRLALETRKARRVATKEVLRKEFNDLSAEFGRLAGRANIGIDPKLAKIIAKMAKNRVEAGIVTVEGVVDDIHAAVKDYLDNKRAVRDAISGYGVTAEMSKDETARTLRDIKQQMRTISAIEDAQRGERPLKSGLQREPYSPGVKQMRERLASELKKQGIIVREPLPPKQGPKLSDVRKLPMEGPRKSEASRSGLPLQGPRKSDAHKLPAEGPRPNEVPMQGPRLTDSRKEGPRDWLPDAKARLQERLVEYERRIREGDFSEPKKREAIVYDREGNQLKAKLEKAKNEYEDLKAKNKKKTVGDYLVRWKRFAVLTYPTTLGKLGVAATGRMIQTPIEEVTGGILSKIPGISGIAERAPREGRLNIKAEVEAVKQLWQSDSFRGMLDQIKGGRDMLDLLYGKKRGDTEFMNLPGRLHGAEKEIPKRAEFYRAFEKRLSFEARKGKDIADPELQMAVAMESYNDAMRAIFMQPNVISDWFNRTMNEAARRGGWLKVASSAGRFIFPITRVPVNYVTEQASLIPPLAAAKVVGKLGASGSRAAIREGRSRIVGFLKGVTLQSLNELKPEEADYVMRAMKKGAGAGMGMVLLGFMRPQNFGGYYQPGEKRKPEDAQAGEVVIMGIHLPRWASHIPLIEAAQVGAQFRRTYDALISKGKGSGAMAEAAIATGWGLADEVPFVKEPQEIYRDVRAGLKGMVKFAGQQARSLVPGIIQDVAGRTDRDATGKTTKRYPQGSSAEQFKQEIQLGVPWWRKSVPDTKPSRSSADSSSSPVVGTRQR